MEKNRKKPEIGKKTIHDHPIGEQERQGSFSTGGKKEKGRFLLLLAPANMLGLVLAALAVVGICAAARTQAHNPVTPPAVSTTDPAVDTTPAVSDRESTAVTEPPVTGGDTTAAGADPLEPGGNPTLPEPKTLHPAYDLSSALLGSSIGSDYAILVDMEQNHVVASKYSNVRIYPASMTKVMTILTAVLRIPEEDFYTKTFRMTNEIITPLVLENATRAGFVGGEDVLLIDYLYGTILPSGADATTALALYCAGSEEAFADMMNETAAELGLKDSHFVNASGLHDPNHYTTVYEMSVIMRAALSIDLCRTVLSTFTYTTHSTPQNPEGLTLYSTGLSRLTPYNGTKYTFVAAKTGYTPEAKQCLVSLIRNASGKEYVFVCAHAAEKYTPPSDSNDVAKRFCTD